jgi:hypothetical protein
MNKLKTIYASVYSSSLTIVAVVILTLVAELSVNFKNWLASFTGHHWVTKSWLSLIIFILFFGIFYSIKSPSSEKIKKAVMTLGVIAILGSLIIFLFYVYEFFVG